MGKQVIAQEGADSLRRPGGKILAISAKPRPAIPSTTMTPPMMRNIRCPRF